MSNTKSNLKRSLGVTDGASIIIANVIGIGIFTTPGVVAGISPGIFPFISLWIAGGLLVCIGALAYADLAHHIPKAGGEYIYLKQAFGPKWGFLSGWTSFIAGFSGAIAASSIGFAEYLLGLVPEGDELQAYSGAIHAASLLPVEPEKAIGMLLIFLVTLFHISRMNVGRYFQNALTLLNILTILALVVLGFAASPDWVFTEQRISGTTEFSGWFLALIPVLFTYSGWNAAVYVAEEIKNPGKNMHRALLAGVGVVIVLYLLLNLLIAGTIPFHTLSESVDVINTMSAALFGPNGMIIFSIVILTALLSSVSAMVLTGPRIYFAMSRDNLFPAAFSQVHPRKNIPYLAVCLQSVWAVILVITGTFEQLLIYTGFSIILFSCLSVLALLVLDHRESRIQLPLVKKVLYIGFVLIGLIIVVNAIYMSPGPSLAGLLLITAGLPVYYWYARAESDADEPTDHPDDE